MKKHIAFALCLAVPTTVACAQETPDAGLPRWEIGADAGLYFIPDDFFMLPVVRADKSNLHLEARYNYEDRETFSGWIGYNIEGGNQLTYFITPMVGGVVGRSDGIAPGVEVTLTFKDFELYSEGEMFFDLHAADSHFFYNWSDFSYAPLDWLWFGISAQRTRVYQTDVDIQRGLLLGAGVGTWEVSAYLYNPGTDDAFGLLVLSKSF